MSVYASYSMYVFVMHSPVEDCQQRVNRMPLKFTLYSMNVSAGI